MAKAKKKQPPGKRAKKPVIKASAPVKKKAKKTSPYPALERYARPPWPPAALGERRGVMTFDTNLIAVLVKAAVGPTAAALVKRLGARAWLKDALGKTVSYSRSPGYLLYQLRGHPYTTVFQYVHAPRGDPTGDVAKALSEALATRVIYFANSDTGGVTTFEAYDAGRRLERFHAADALEFSSTLRDESECPKDGPWIYPFVDMLVHEHDAFVPCWFPAVLTMLPGTPREGALALDASVLGVDVDYPDGPPEPLFVRVDYVAV